MLLDENTPEFAQDENESETVEEVEESTEDEEQDVDWKAEALKYKAILARNKEKKADAPKVEEQKDGFGYDVKAYLKASGIKADEFDFVKKELKSFNGDVEELIENDYFQAKLEKQRAIKKTDDATPKGKRTGNVATNSVEYWMGKPLEDVPADMRIKVVNAQIEKDKNRGIFYNS